MCGIIGKVNGEIDSFKRGLEKIRHRGPDFNDYVEICNDENKILLGHARLSILDLDSRSNQPFSSNNRYHLVYNGEIYNYLELKKELHDINFKTSSDTEVLYQWLIRFGTSRLNELSGMFSFCFYDNITKDVLLVRDQLGIKPLYYKIENKSLSFCSEVRGLREIIELDEGIDKNFISHYLNLGYNLEPFTGFKNIFKIFPGSYLKFNIQTKSQIKKQYWSPSNITNPSKIGISQKIFNSIKNHLISDVPVGVFYSGGVDSSLIATQIPKNSKFLISKSSRKELKSAGIIDDNYYAQKISKKLNFKLTTLNIDNDKTSFIEKIKHVVELNEEPIADFTSYPTSLLSKEARKLNLKVMLSGMGADELFGGYPRYLLLNFRKYLSFFKFLFPLLKYSKFLSKKISRLKDFSRANSEMESYMSLLTPFNRAEISKLSNQESYEKFLVESEELWSSCKSNSLIKTAMKFDIYGFLSHNFLLADKASMTQSIEMRVPLATKDLFESSISLPEKDLINILTSKVTLKKILSKYLPKELIYRRKSGFHPPLDDKINLLGKDYILEIFNNDDLGKFVNLSIVKEIVISHFKGIENNTFKIYRLLFLNFWIKKNIK